MKFCLHGLIVLLLASFAFESTGQEPHYYERAELILGEDTLEVLYGAPSVFITVDQMRGFDKEDNFQRVAAMATWNGKPFKKNRYTIDGESKHTLRWLSSDTAITEPVKPHAFLSAGFFVIKTIGRVELLAVVDNRDTLRIPIRVQALDIESNFGDQAIVDFIGEPDHRTNVRVFYNTVEVVDGIRYDARDMVKGRIVHHWLYDAYPGAVLVLDPVDYREHVIVQMPGWLQIADLLFENM